MSASRPRLLLLISEDWYFWSHRLRLARSAQQAGYEVLVATSEGAYADRIREAGFELIPVRIPRRASQFPAAREAVRELTQLYRRLRPDVVHHVTITCILLGSLAARRAGVPAVVNAFAGLGRLQTRENWKTWMFRNLAYQSLRYALPRRGGRVIAQNQEDLDDLVRAGVVRPDESVVINGVGVDLEKFAPQPKRYHPPLVLLAARMLWSKGVADFVEAAQRLRARGSDARFALAGRLDLENPDHVPPCELERWELEAGVEWLGHREDMPELLSQASVVCLPTYYGEGLPKILLEAAASGKPTIASDTRGCRSICRAERTGLLIPPRSPGHLAAAVERLLGDAPLRLRLGQAARQLVENEFDDREMARQTLEVYRQVLPHSPPVVRFEEVWQ